MHKRIRPILIAFFALVGSISYVSSIQAQVTASELDKALYYAVDAHDVNKVRNLLEQGANPNAIVGGTTALARAAYSFGTDNLNIAKMLIGKGACINAIVDGGKTTPVFIALNSDAPLFQLLVANGADLNFPYPDKKNSYFYGLRPTEYLKKQMECAGCEGTNGYYTALAMLKVINNTSSTSVQKCSNGTSRNQNKAVTSPTPAQGTLPYTIAPADDAKEQVEREKQAEREEEERANERTRAFNEQKQKEKCPPGVVCVGRADISDDEATDERTRAFNEQKRKQSASAVQPSKPKPRRNGRKKPR